MKLWEVIEYTDSDFVYKHPCEDFNSNSKIIVREGQTAIFVKNGTICDCFEAGRYKLKTENIPILKRIMSLPTGGECSFSAEIYYINTTDIMNVKWGTSTPMELQDPKYNIIVRVGANGDSTFRITNAKEFFKRIIGVKKSFAAFDLVDYFRSLINMYIKNSISDILVVDNISILKINSCLVAISDKSKELLDNELSKYGLSLIMFTLENVVIPKDDEGLQELKKALSKKSEMDIVGYTYAEKRQFDVMEDVANNSNSGGLMNSFLGMGLGLGLAHKSFNNMQNSKNIFDSPTNNTNTTKPVDKEENKNICNHCNYVNLDDAVFCENCGKKIGETICPNCKKPVLANAKFCRYCGGSLSEK